jgi:Flp pilus assembly protein TadG
MMRSPGDPRHGSGATRRPKRRRTRGQSLVEFALILPVFLLMFFGIVDGARYVYLNSVLSQAAREGARLLSAEASWIGSSDASCNPDTALSAHPGGPVCPATVTGSGTTSLQTHITMAVNRNIAPFGPASVIYFQCNGTGSAPSGNWTGTSCGVSAPNNLASVRVVLTFTPLTPIIAQVMGTITTSGSATMVIN